MQEKTLKQTIVIKRVDLDFKTNKRARWNIQIPYGALLYQTTVTNCMND